MKNLVIFGASGNIGQKISYFAAQSALSQSEETNIYLVSRNFDKVEGLTLDISPSLSLLGKGSGKVSLMPTTYDSLSNSIGENSIDCFVISAGGNRSIENLAQYNQNIMHNFATKVLENSNPNTRVVMVTSPVDSMIREFNQVWSQKFDTSSVLGVSSALTEERGKLALKMILSEAGVEVLPEDIDIKIYGVHNKAAIDRDNLTIKGQKIEDFITENSGLNPDELLSKLYKDTFAIGNQIRSKTGNAASFSTASCTCMISNALMYDEIETKIRASVENSDDGKVYAQPLVISKNGIIIEDIPNLHRGDQIKFSSGIKDTYRNI